MWLFFQMILTVLVLSLDDVFVFSLVYSADKVKISHAAVMVMVVIHSAVICVSLLAGDLISSLIDPQIITWICFGLLCIIGISKIISGFKKEKIEGNRKMPIKEAILLSLGFSLDELTAGFFVGAYGVNILLFVAISVVMGFMLCYLGIFIGSHINKKFNLNLSVFTGIILIAAGIANVLF